MMTICAFVLRDKKSDSQGSFNPPPSEAPKLSAQPANDAQPKKTSAAPKPNVAAALRGKPPTARTRPAHESSTAIPLKDSTAAAWIDSQLYIPKSKPADPHDVMKALWEPLTAQMDEEDDED